MGNATDLLTATQVCDNRMECRVSAEACGICGIMQLHKYLCDLFLHGMFFLCDL